MKLKLLIIILSFSSVIGTTITAFADAEDDEYTLVETDTEDKTGIVGAETSAERCVNIYHDYLSISSADPRSPCAE